MARMSRETGALVYILVPGLIGYSSIEHVLRSNRSMALRWCSERPAHWQRDSPLEYDMATVDRGRASRPISVLLCIASAMHIHTSKDVDVLAQ